MTSRTFYASWTATARVAAGEQLAGPSGIYAPPADTGETLGFAPARLTLTFGLGPSLFDDRFGLHDKRPVALVDLPGFPGDALDTSLSGGDLCIQACADDAQVAFHAIHNLSRLALGAAVLRYVHCGFAASAVGPPAPRNLLGFQDGTANLDAADSAAMDRHVWVGDDNDQAWMRGGTYLVFRRIRIHLEQWDRMTLDDQEQTIGRKKTPVCHSAHSTRPTLPISVRSARTGCRSSPTVRTSGWRAQSSTTARRSCGGVTASPTASIRRAASSTRASSSSAFNPIRASNSSRSSNALRQAMR